MIEVFDSETVNKINLAVGRQINITVFCDRAIIKLDWQSYFQIEKKSENGAFTYHIYYVERGDKLNYGDYDCKISLINALIAKLKNAT